MAGLWMMVNISKLSWFNLETLAWSGSTLGRRWGHDLNGDVSHVLQHEALPSKEIEK